MAETSIIPPIQTSNIHKRFKSNNNISHSESSNEDLYITSKVIRCNSSPINIEPGMWNFLKP